MGVIINGRPCEAYGLHLVSCRISVPKRKSQWVNVPGSDSCIDLMRNIGPARYEQRTVSMVFRPTAFDGDFAKRILDALNDQILSLRLPGYEDYTISGIAQIVGIGCDKNEPVSISVTCDPWFVAIKRQMITVSGTSAGVSAILRNQGTRDIIPSVDVQSNVRITSGTTSIALSKGTHLVPDLIIQGHASRSIMVYDGAARFHWQEAIL